MTYQLFFSSTEDAATSVKKLIKDGWHVRQLDLSTLTVYAVIPGGLEKLFNNGVLTWDLFKEFIKDEYGAIEYVQVAYAQAAEVVI